MKPTELLFELKKGKLTVKPKKSAIELFFGCCSSTDQSNDTSLNVDKAVAKAVLENDNATLSHIVH